MTPCRPVAAACDARHLRVTLADGRARAASRCAALGRTAEQRSTRTVAARLIAPKIDEDIRRRQYAAWPSGDRWPECHVDMQNRAACDGRRSVRCRAICSTADASSRQMASTAAYDPTDRSQLAAWLRRSAAKEAETVSGARARCDGRTANYTVPQSAALALQTGDSLVVASNLKGHSQTSAALLELSPLADRCGRRPRARTSVCREHHQRGPKAEGAGTRTTPEWLLSDGRLDAAPRTNRPMKFTLSWLKDHLDTTASLAEIVETLTRVGLEVEGVEDPAAKYEGFVVASVIEAKQHPNADRLRVLHRRRGRRAGAGRLRRAERAHGHEKRVLARRNLHSRQEADPRQGRASAASNRTACCARRPSSSSARTMTGSSNCPPMRPSAWPTPASPGSTIRSSTSP